MSSSQITPSKFMTFPLSVLVKTICIPSDPITQLGYDLSKPITYVIPFLAKTDLLTLRKQCIALGLPDPYEPLVIDDITTPRCFFVSQGKKAKKELTDSPSVAEFSTLIKLHKENPALDIQLIPVSIVWDRTPGTESRPALGLRAMGKMEKARTIFFHGRDCMVRFSSALSFRYLADSHGNDDALAKKLVRVANIHFSRQFKAASGPNLPDRQAMFKRLLASEAIEHAVQHDAKHRNLPAEKVRREAVGMLQEIAAKFSPTLIRMSDNILSWVWSRIYHGLNITNAEKVRKLAHAGCEIVYVPCHRSHMDYVLLSYVLYKEGLVPPHIAAGINLNFFPAGPIFRRGGAFFLRRSFRGNVLYSTIFREYLSELFAKGYSMEFFPEGGRSRTGRLRKPKLGMLAMTVGAMLRGTNRTLAIVPVYIGYEHIMEVNTYAKELKGMHKEKENIGQVLGILGKLRNYGEGYVNFGEPINVNQVLSQHNPNWQQESGSAQSKPAWLQPIISGLATEIMTRINDATAANGLTLCATALLASTQHALSRESLEEQLDVYLSLLRAVPYSSSCTVSSVSAKQLVDHVTGLDKFIIEIDALGEMILLDQHRTVLMTYYRNNIIHMLIIPSLIAHIFVYKRQATRQEICDIVGQLYPFLKAELFMNLDSDSLGAYVEAQLEQFEKLELINVNENGSLYRNRSRLRPLQLLGNTVTETLQRYALTLTLYNNEPDASKGELDQQSQLVAQRLSRLHNINAPEFADKEVFTTMINTLYQEGYLDKELHAKSEKIDTLRETVLSLISPDVQLTIEAISH